MRAKHKIVMRRTSCVRALHEQWKEQIPYKKPHLTDNTAAEPASVVFAGSYGGVLYTLVGEILAVDQRRPVQQHHKSSACQGSQCGAVEH